MNKNKIFDIQSVQARGRVKDSVQKSWVHRILPSSL